MKILAMIPCVFASIACVHAGLDEKSVLLQTHQEKSSNIEYRFSTGVGYRQFGGVNFQTGDVSHRLPLFQENTPSRKAGKQGKIANRIYDNGYIQKDTGTVRDGLTGFFGYSDSNQVQEDRISYHSNLGYAANYRTTEWNASEDAIQPSLAFSMLLPFRNNLRFWPYLSVAYSEISEERNGLQTLQAMGQTLRDSYLLNGVILPTAPYAGTFNGPGPVINNIPITRQLIANGNSASNEIKEFLDLDLITSTLGAALEYQLGKFELQGLVGFTINFTQVKAGHDEKLFLNSTNGNQLIEKSEIRHTDTDFLYGFTSQFSLSYQVTQNWSAGLYGRYDWLDGLKANIGPSSYSVDLDGWSTGAVITYKY